MGNRENTTYRIDLTGFDGTTEEWTAIKLVDNVARGMGIGESPSEALDDLLRTHG